jgi:hypothetical protein
MAYQASDDVIQKEFEVNNAATTFRAGNFEGLNAKLENFAEFGQTTNGGDWYLMSDYDGLARVVDEALDDDELDEIEGQAEAWVRAFPKSANAYLGYATILIQRGVRAGAGGVIAKETIARVRALLDEHRDILVSNPHYHAILVRLAIAENADLGGLSPLIEAAARAHPSYSAPWLLAAEHLLARSADGAADLESLARLVLENTRTVEGSAQYARIYQHALEVAYGTDLFKASKVTWLDLKAGISALSQRFPHSGLNMNEFALMACLTGDRDALKPLIKNIEGVGRTPPESIWGDLNFFEQCRSWAAGDPSARKPLMPPNPIAAQLTPRRLSFDPKRRMTATFETDLRNRLRNDFVNVLYEDGFKSLENLSQRYRSLGTRTPSGLPLLLRFYRGIESVYAPGIEENYERVESRLQSYLQQFPNSPTPIVLYAHLMKVKATMLRDRKTEAGEPEPFALKAADQLLSQAADFLNEHKEIGQADPAWYIHMIDIRRFQRWPTDKLDALVVDGAKRHGGHYSVLFAGALVHLSGPDPRGVAADIEKYARSVAKNFAAKDSPEEIYAQMYWLAEEIYFGYGLFEYSHADWSEIRRGFEKLTRTYPTGWNQNAFAYFSCIAGDAAKLRELLPVIEAHNEEPPWDIWKMPELRDACLEFARSAPVEANPGPDASPEQDPT